MLVVMNHVATKTDIDRVCRSIENLGFQARPIPGEQRTSIGVVGNEGRVDSTSIEGLPGVLRVIHVSSPYKQVSREWKPDDTVIGFCRFDPLTPSLEYHVLHFQQLGLLPKLLQRFGAFDQGRGRASCQG